MSWIHEADLNRQFERALTNSTMQWTYIASSPNPVSQIKFMRARRYVLGVPIGLPAYAWMVRFGAHYLLRTDPELALYGRYVVSKRLKQEGFQFCWNDIGAALNDLCTKDGD